MKKLHLSLSAEADIQSIFSYTLETWGELQFEKYVQIIDEALELITSEHNHPLIRQREDLFPECQSIKAGHHVIFFRLHNKTIEVIRVLHQKMDIPSYFNLEEEE